MSEVLPHSAFHGTGGSAGPTLTGGAVGYTAPHVRPPRSARRHDAAVTAWGALMGVLSETLPTSLAHCNRHRRAILHATAR